MLTKDDLLKIDGLFGKRFDIVDKRFDSLGKHIDEVETNLKLDNVAIRREIFSLESHLEDQDKKFIRIETKMKNLEKNIKTVVNYFDKWYLGLLKRIERIEQHLGLSSFAQ